LAQDIWGQDLLGRSVGFVSLLPCSVFSYTHTWRRPQEP